MKNYDDIKAENVTCFFNQSFPSKVYLSDFYLKTLKCVDSIKKRDLMYLQEYGNEDTVFISPTGELPLDLCTCIGLWISDGLGSDLISDSLEILNFVQNTLYSIVRKDSIELDKNTITLKGVTGYIFIKELTEQILSSICFDRHVPSFILTGDTDYQKAYLRGVFESSCVKIRERFDKRLGISDFRRYIRYTTRHSVLHTQISFLLKNMNIKHKISEEYISGILYNNDRCVRYTITISDSLSLIRFSDFIGFIRPSRKKSLKKIVEVIEALNM